MSISSSPFLIGQMHIMLRNSLSSHLAPSTQLIDQPYNLTRVFDKKTFSIDQAGYDAYSKIYLSVFAFSYGINFSTLTAAISHVALFHESKSLQHYCFLSIFLAIFPSHDLISFKIFVLELLCKCGVKQGRWKEMIILLMCTQD